MPAPEPIIETTSTADPRKSLVDDVVSVYVVTFAPMMIAALAAAFEPAVLDMSTARTAFALVGAQPR